MTQKALKKFTKKDLLKEVKGYLFMILGCIAYGASTSLFLAPNTIIAGGVTGLSVMINFLTPVLMVGMISIIINVPILLLGLKLQGLKFILKCLVTIVCLGLITDLITEINVLIRGESLPITNDATIASVYGGICQGVGIGLFVKFQFSSGGTELLARVISRLVKVINIPVCLGLLDGAVVIIGSIVTGEIQNIFYALIVVFLSTKVSELVLFGLDKSKLCIIISDKGEEISKELLSHSRRGITMLSGEGMYTHREHQVLLTCVKNNQLTQLKKFVYEVDEKAFVIISEAIEVRGLGFKALNEDIENEVKKAINKKQQTENKQEIQTENQN